MLIERRDLYKIKVNLKKSGVSATMEIEYLLNQMNLNNDGKYNFKIKDIRDLNTGELIQDAQRKMDVAEILVGLFNEEPTNFLGKTATEISLNF